MAQVPKGAPSLYHEESPDAFVRRLILTHTYEDGVIAAVVNRQCKSQYKAAYIAKVREKAAASGAIC